ncbi:hypothetical protein [Haloarcula salinisoli]|nr:hypothetical protein [Halomicroarcula salinisoli]
MGFRLALSILSTLGWTDADEEHYALNEDQVEHVTDDEVRLSSGL